MTGWPSTQPSIMSVVHLRFCSIIASLYLSPWPAFHGNTRLTYGPTCLRSNKHSTDRDLPQNALLQREPRSRCFVLIHPTLRQHVVMMPTSSTLRPNAHSSTSRPPAPPSSTLANKILAACTTRSTVLPTICNSTDDKQRDLVFARGAPQGTGHIHHHYTSQASPPMQVDAHSEH
jgi:hypothetical protein